jgi:hypothetical protein
VAAITSTELITLRNCKESQENLCGIYEIKTEHSVIVQRNVGVIAR